MIDDWRSVLTPRHAITSVKRRKAFRVISLTLLSVIVFILSLGFYFYKTLNDKFFDSVVDINHLEPINNSENGLSDVWEGRAINLLVMGIDARVGQDEDLIGKMGKDKTIRSDTTMVIHISADRENVDVISLPRDLLLQLPECYKTSGEVIPSSWGQFNWAFSLAAGEDDLPAGIACMKQNVENFTNLKMDGFAVVDFTGFYKIIEILGDVPYCTEVDIKDGKYLDFELEAGCHDLTPLQATQLARVRHTGDGSDMGRIDRQQALVSSMITKTMSTEVLTDPAKMYALIDSIIEVITVSESLGSINKVSGLAWSLKDIDKADIRFVTAPVLTAEEDQNRLIPRYTLFRDFFTAVKDDEEWPDEIAYSTAEGENFLIVEGVPEQSCTTRWDDEFGNLYNYEYLFRGQEDFWRVLNSIE